MAENRTEAQLVWFILGGVAIGLLGGAIVGALTPLGVGFGIGIGMAVGVVLAVIAWFVRRGRGPSAG